jgi:cytochrome c oxidase subunit 4
MAHQEAAHGTHGHDEHAHHPSPMQYVKIGAILTAITIWEVWAYYIPSLVASKIFIPMLLILSAVKFAVVVMFYMHLKYDHKLFRALFTGPLMIAMVTLTGLLFLFGKVAIRLAGQS